MSKDGYDLFKIIEQLGKLHIEQARLQKQEKDLITKLVACKQKTELELTGVRRDRSFKARATAGNNHFTTGAEDLKKASLETSRKEADDRDNAQTNTRTPINCVSFKNFVSALENKTDRFGKELKVGDKVEFLTDGLYSDKQWTIYKLTSSRVLCKRKGGQKTHREYQNVRLIE